MNGAIIPTDQGPILWCRCIVYDRELLVFGHHWLSPNRKPPEDGPDRLQSHAIAGLEKTARRFYAIIDQYPWCDPKIVDLPTPETICFKATEPDLFFDLCHLRQCLIQSETLTLEPSGHLTFRRA